MLTSSLITSPARYDVEPSCTIPLRMGGDQLELRTLSPASKARACFIASHPAIFAKKDSESATAIQRPNERSIGPIAPAVQGRAIEPANAQDRILLCHGTGS